MCGRCDTDRIQTTTTFTVEYNDCIIVIKNVPCLECQMCGETTFTDDVAEKLEIIVEKAKAVLQEISVIDYSRVA